MIDLNKQSVIDELHRAGWCKVPKGNVLVEADVLASLVFTSMDGLDRTQLRPLLEKVKDAIKRLKNPFSYIKNSHQTSDFFWRI